MSDGESRIDSRRLARTAETSRGLFPFPFPTPQPSEERKR